MSLGDTVVPRREIQHSPMVKFHEKAVERTTSLLLRIRDSLTRLGACVGLLQLVLVLQQGGTSTRLSRKTHTVLKAFPSIMIDIVMVWAITNKTRRTSIVQALGHECDLNVKSDTISRPSNDVATVPSLRNSTVAAHRVTRPGGFPITFPSREVERSRSKAMNQRQAYTRYSMF